jgi:hypothetical protein
VTTRAQLGFWTPTNDTAQAIAAALKAHWTEAKKAAATSPFFKRGSANWLEMSRHTLTRATSHAAPAIAATSDAAGMNRHA